MSMATWNKNPSEKQGPKIFSTFIQVLRFQGFNAWGGLFKFKRMTEATKFLVPLFPGKPQLFYCIDMP